MRKLLIINTLCLFLMIRSLAQFSPDSLKNYLATLPADMPVSVVILDKDSTVLFQQNANKIVPAASSIKVPILIELLYQTIANRYKLSDEYFVKETDKVGGSGDLQYEPPQKLSFEQLATEMIRVSDNTATNILIEKVGMKNVNAMLTYHGFVATQLNRKMMDFEAIKLGKQNYTSAAESARLMYLLLTNKILNENNCKKALEILLTCQDVTTIPRYIPTTVPIAHKTGTLDYVRIDVGVIFGDNPLIISILVENYESVEFAETVIGTISKIAFDSW